MNFNITIQNSEDIEILKKIDSTKINDYLCTSISIGLKAIEMSDTVMTGNSYYNPIKKLIDDSSKNNELKLDNINLMLQDLLNIKNNSSKKGKLGECLAYNNLIKKYPDWIVTDTTGISHEGDFYMYSHQYGKILYEIKTYTSNVNNKEIIKFKNDIINSNSDHGIFVSQTSGIANKKMFDIELLDNKLLIYISNSGLNGHGIEIATEFLLMLINTGYIKNQTIIKEDYNINLIIQTINDKLLDCKECINNFSRLKTEINRTHDIINSSMSTLYKHCIEYEVKSNKIYEDLFKSVQIINNNFNNDAVLNYEKNIILKKISDSNHFNLNILFDLFNTLNVKYGIDLKSSIIYITNENKIICKIIEDNNLVLYFPIYSKNININLNHETIYNNNIILKINNIDDNIKNIIINRLQ